MACLEELELDLGILWTERGDLKFGTQGEVRLGCDVRRRQDSALQPSDTEWTPYQKEFKTPPRFMT